MKNFDLIVRRRFALIALMSLLVLGVALPQAVSAESLDPSRVAWTDLVYKGKKLMFSIDAEIGIEVVPSAKVKKSLVEATKGEGLYPEGDSSVLLTLTSEGLGTKARTRFWLGPEAGVALQRAGISEKKSKRGRKTHRFTETGVQIFFHEPAQGEDATRPENWTGGSDRFDSYPDWAGTDLQVSESTALFYLLAVAELNKPGDQIQFPVVSKGQLALAELKVVGLESIKVDYMRESGGKTVRVRGQVPVIKILVEAQQLDPGAEEADLDFMNMKGDIAIYLDPESRAPLRISGKVPVAGMAHVRVQRITLK
jgi:hypothetical protein